MLMKLIDKNKLLEELKNLKQNLSASPIVVIEDVESLVENLKVKEVDFDAEWEKYFEHRGEMATVNVKHLAKYFFELGIKVAQKGE